MYRAPICYGSPWVIIRSMADCDQTPGLRRHPLIYFHLWLLLPLLNTPQRNLDFGFDFFIRRTHMGGI